MRSENNADLIRIDGWFLISMVKWFNSYELYEIVQLMLLWHAIGRMDTSNTRQ